MIKMTEEEYHLHCRDFDGVCLGCGETADSVEPDAEGYECEACGESTVCGIEWALILGEIEIV